MADPGSEDEFRTRLLKGDADGLAAAFEFFRNRLRQTIKVRMDRRLSGRLDPSDVLQETFLTAVRELPRYVAGPDVPVFVWLHGLTTRRLVDLHREHLAVGKRAVGRESSGNCPGRNSHHSDNLLSELVSDSVTSPSSVILREERKQQVLQGLVELDDIDREVLVLRHFEMLTNDETAAILGLTRTAASNRYIRSLQRLQFVLAEIMERT